MPPSTEHPSQGRTCALRVYGECTESVYRKAIDERITQWRNQGLRVHHFIYAREGKSVFVHEDTLRESEDHQETLSLFLGQIPARTLVVYTLPYEHRDQWGWLGRHAPVFLWAGRDSSTGLQRKPPFHGQPLPTTLTPVFDELRGCCVAVQVLDEPESEDYEATIENLLSVAGTFGPTIIPVRLEVQGQRCFPARSGLESEAAQRAFAGKLTQNEIGFAVLPHAALTRWGLLQGCQMAITLEPFSVVQSRNFSK